MATARVIAAAVAAVLLGLVQWLPPVLAGRLVPSLLDCAVGAAFAAAAVVTSGRQRVAATAALAVGAVFWALSGAATVLPGIFGDLALRTSLLPHALLVAVVVTLPTGRMRGARVTILASAALAVGVLAGLGIIRPALLALGAVALLSAIARWKGATSAVQVALGLALVAIDTAALAGALPPALASVAVDLVLVGGVIATALVLTERNRLWSVTADPRERGTRDPLGDQLGTLLGVRGLRVGFPRGTQGAGGFVDVTGRPIDLPDTAMRFGDRTGETVALVHPLARIDPFLESNLLGILERARDLARLRAIQRDRATEIEQSRRVLLRAADDERADLELRLSTTVGVQLDRVIAELELLPAEADLDDRARAVRAEVLGFGHAALEPDSAATLESQLRILCDSAGLALTCSIDPAFEPPAPLLRAAWFTCVEGIVNTAKHAPGAAITIVASVHGRSARLTVSDDGPGGARAGSGLEGLADRAADAGARFAVTSTDAGTRLELAFELPGFPPAPARVFHDVAPSRASVA